MRFLFCGWEVDTAENGCASGYVDPRMVWIGRSSSVMASSRDGTWALGRLRAVSSGRGLGAGYANLAAQDFPGGALGQLVDEPHLAGGFVGSDPVFDEGADLRCGGGDARVEHDGGADLFAQ